MSAPAIIETLREAGLNLSLTNKSGVKVAPASRLTDKLRGLIRAHKAELVDWLEAANDPEPDLRGWSVTLATSLPTSTSTIAKFRAASQALDRQIAEPVAPDRWAWPHSDAMNTSEIAAFTARLTRFAGKGLSVADAEAMADRLVIRDRDGDDRRLCLECRHLSGRRCTAWRIAGIGGPEVGDLRTKLQRCDGFEPTSGGQP